MDDLVAEHPELDEKSLRRGYAQVKSAAKKTTTTGAKGKKKTSKRSSKRAGKKTGKRASVSTELATITRQLAPADPNAEAHRLAAELTGNTQKVRAFILQHGTLAIRSALEELGELDS